MNKLKLGFRKFSDANFGTKTEAILQAMTDNATLFPTPVPALTVITDAIGNYMQALIEAKGKSTTAVAIKNMYREELTSSIVQLGSYVMLTAAGDITVLIASGFDLAKTKEPAPPLERPDGFQVLEGLTAGEFLMKVKRQKSAKGYQFQVTATDPSAPESEPVWISQLSSKSKITFPGLESGKRYWCRVGITGPSGQQLYSDIVSKLAQ